MNNLGRIYAKGKGGAKDIRKAENLYKKAIDAGCMVALSLAKGEEAEFLQAEQAGLLCLIRRYCCPIYFQAFERAGQNCPVNRLF